MTYKQEKAVTAISNSIAYSVNVSNASIKTHKLKEKKMKKAFKNESGFQDCYQYCDGSGQEWRIEKDNYTCKFYKLDDEGECFIFEQEIYLNKDTTSIKVMHALFEQKRAEQDYAYENRDE